MVVLVVEGGVENGVSPSEAVMSIDPVLPYDFDLSCTFAVVLVVVVAELDSPVDERSDDDDDDGTVQLLPLALLTMPNISLIGENCGWRTNFPT